MRLIFITDTLCSGGAEKVISILANNFCKVYPTEIICLRKRDVFYHIENHVKVVQAEDYAQGIIGRALWLRRYLRDDDIIIPFMVKVYCVVLLSLLGKKRIVIASERNDPKVTSAPWRLIRRLVLHKMTLLIVQSQSIKEYFPKQFYSKIRIIRNPLDLNQCSNNSWNKESKLILAIGRTDPQKNYPMMIRAFNNVLKINPEYKLEIWGSRNESEIALNELINSLQANNNISIHGRTNNVKSLYSRAYMFVMTSDYEGMSNALIEALCSGLPVISTKVSGAIDLIANNKNGLLVDVGDEEGFYKAINYLIENPSVAERMSKYAKQSRILFSKEIICNEWNDLFRKMINN